MMTTFHEIGLTARKRFTCACGRQLTRQKRFYQTLNPFNLKDGRPKNQGEILVECRAEAGAWTKTTEPCWHEALRRKP